MYGTFHFENNLIVRREGKLKLLDVRGFEKVLVGPNQIELGPDSGDVEARVADCPDAKLADQQILGPAGATAKVKLERVKKATCEGWQKN